MRAAWIAMELRGWFAILPLAHLTGNRVSLKKTILTSGRMKISDRLVRQLVDEII
ncbi:MAG: hypothetical protein KKF57_12050 [Firmicutes bacterium]|nr:hypothetical protein [Bacillota bacterium]